MATGPFVKLTRRWTISEQQTDVVWVNVAQVQAVHERMDKDGNMYSELWLAGDESALFVNEPPAEILQAIARPAPERGAWDQIHNGAVDVRE